MNEASPKNWLRIIRNRVILGVLLFLLVVGVGAYAVMSNFFGESQKTEAAPGVSCTSDAIPTCTFSGGGSISWTEGQYENANIIISDIEVVSYGRHNINSLYIADGGVLTHDALVYPRDFAVGPGNIEMYLLSAEGKRRKVDLNVAGDLTFEHGGRINVDGKGFPGKLGVNVAADCNDNCGFGYGPGGGESADTHDALAFGGGGGYGGDGGNGVGNGGGGDAGVFPVSLFGEAYTIDTAWHGSAGGAARKHDNPAEGSTDGRAGGGVVFIQARDVITAPVSGFLGRGGKITAAGIAAGDGGGTCISNKRCSGAGSGGSIYLFLRNYSANTKFNVSSDGGLSNVSGRSGVDSSPVLSGFANDLGYLMTINADGGRAGPSYRYYVNSIFGIMIPHYDLDAKDSGVGGGGGRIMIQANDTFMTIEKKIEPVERVNSTGIVDDFNPYSLQVNDTVKVKIRVINIKNGAIVSDVPLKEVGVSGGYVCRPISSSPTASLTSDETVSWTYTESDAGEASFEYNCKVTK